MISSISIKLASTSTSTSTLVLVLCTMSLKESPSDGILLLLKFTYITRYVLPKCQHVVSASVYTTI